MEASLGCRVRRARQGVAARVYGAAGSSRSTDSVRPSLLADGPGVTAQEQASSASAAAAEIGRRIGHGEDRDIVYGLQNGFL